MDKRVNDQPEAAENRALGTATGECIMLQRTKGMHFCATSNA
jgi:hypothetical protein